MKEAIIDTALESLSGLPARWQAHRRYFTDTGPESAIFVDEKTVFRCGSICSELSTYWSISSVSRAERRYYTHSYLVQ